MARQIDINTYFRVATARGDRAMMQALLDAGADIEVRNFNGETALIQCCDDPEIVAHLIATGADINAQNARGQTALTNAAAEGLEEVVALLLQHGAKPNLADRDERTALMVASERGHQHCTTLLLAHHASANTHDSHNHSALDLAIAEGQVRIVEILLAHRAFFSKGAETARRAVYYQRQGRLLNDAGLDGYLAAVQALLADGIEAGFVVDTYHTPLLGAAGQGHTEIVKLLLAYGACPEPVRNGVDSPLGRAVLCCHTDIIHALLAAGANPNTQDLYGKTPLHYGLFQDGYPQLLLTAGADPNIADREGFTPLDRLCAYLAPRGLLLDHLGQAQRQTGNAVAALLRAHGARPHSLQATTPQEYLRSLLQPYAIPEELHALHSLEAELRATGLTLANLLKFKLLENEVYDQGLRPPGCLPFAYIVGSGNHFAFFSPAAQQDDIATTPIVVYGEDMAFPQARVVADNLRNFLALLIRVCRADLLYAIDARPDRLEEVEAECQAHTQNWSNIQQVCKKLQHRFTLPHIDAPDEYIIRCRRHFPEIEEWDPEAMG